ncbi:MiaB/RimO family radical SAM methylthiotransferase [Frankia sp. Cppng1_Ct_nod]|uniref:MiaB/RimO family radical SAM methylthiotransferase n=1 Tax=Frankia sp. Cppng1_Ct_nod TaxID=2897162 RepID=UPI002024F16B|nr:MiaB/RimO family radical SAM methylthiotransferase [Frankia sp. Cppng1_Ct_nod]
MPDRPVRRVALITLGCSRNDVDSEELAARLGVDGWTVVDDPAGADAVVVNTCGFVEVAKKDSIDTVLAAADLRDGAGGPKAVVAVGCLAERYGRELADSLPEADAVLGFDAYPALGTHLDAVLRGEAPKAHTPRDRRTLLPITPVDRQASRERTEPAQDQARVGPASGPPVLRQRLAGGPVAPLKISSGCDRRCAFCAIPTFRGSHVSRPPHDVLAEAEWLAGQGVRELVLVSENSTSYGKDLGDLRALEKLLPQLAAISGVVRVRAVYLQPAEVRPSLLETLLTTPGVAPYLDLSFQHASPSVLRRMRRFGGADAFCELLARARSFAPELGARSNVIVGFPGETRADVAILERFLEDADLDAVGVFGYSDEDGTEAANLPDKVAPATVSRRHRRLTDLVEQLTAVRAESRIGSGVEVLVEEIAGGLAYGRAAHQQPDVDGACTVRVPTGPVTDLRVGDLVSAKVVAAEGVDLVAEFVDVVDSVTT